eukprot:s2178_g12.t1
MRLNLHILFCWMDSPCLSHTWVRFYQVENEQHQHDLGDTHQPIFLQPPHGAVTSTCLQGLINLWAQAYGMETALLDTPDIVICHVDRFARQQDGMVQKLYFQLHADMMCTLPIWNAAGCQVLQSYVPVALLAHLGDHHNGHFRAALRLTVSDGPDALHTQSTLWALTDDNVAPQIHSLPGLPAWLCTNLTMIWLVRQDCVDTFRPLRDPGAGWMRLRTLRKQVAQNVTQLNSDANAPSAPLMPHAPAVDAGVHSGLPATLPDDDAMDD